PSLAAFLAQLASVLIDDAKFEESEPLAAEGLAICERKVPDNWLTFNARSVLGACLLGQKKFADAETLLLSGFEGMKRREEKIPASGQACLKKALQRLVRLYEKTDRANQAEKWKTELTEWYRNEVARRREAAAVGIPATQNVAWLLATCEDSAIRNGPEAVA